MADNRTISQLEAEGYPWIGCECCKGTVWVPFRMLRERIPMLSAMMLDQLGASVLIGKSVTFWLSLDQGGGEWGRAELLRSTSTML